VAEAFIQMRENRFVCNLTCCVLLRGRASKLLLDALAPLAELDSVAVLELFTDLAIEKILHVLEFFNLFVFMTLSILHFG